MRRMVKTKKKKTWGSDHGPRFRARRLPSLRRCPLLGSLYRSGILISAPRVGVEVPSVLQTELMKCVDEALEAVEVVPESPPPVQPRPPAAAPPSKESLVNAGIFWTQGTGRLEGGDADLKDDDEAEDEDGKEVDVKPNSTFASCSLGGALSSTLSI